ncbi:MAG: hypothetical protein EA381_08405 [Planctomycetaceae bacterium]|nr:MAG: hypothetical protein EA381_08405 [Planctomycetaceae bacterium]
MPDKGVEVQILSSALVWLGSELTFLPISWRSVFPVHRFLLRFGVIGSDGFAGRVAARYDGARRIAGVEPA